MQASDVTDDDWYLSGLTDEVKGAVFPIRGPILVGRAKESDFCLPIIRLSRRHAKLSLYNGGVLIEDLQSSNGTFINGRKVSNVIAKVGDIISFDDVAFTLRGPVHEESIHSDHTQIGQHLHQDQTVVHDRAAFNKALAKAELDLPAKPPQSVSTEPNQATRPPPPYADPNVSEVASSKKGPSAISQQRKKISGGSIKKVDYLEPKVDLPDSKLALIGGIVGSTLVAIIVIAVIVLLT